MSVIKVYRYHRPIWLPIILTGILTLLIAAYVLLPAQSVNAAGPGDGIPSALTPVAAEQQVAGSSPGETAPAEQASGPDEPRPPRTPAPHTGESPLAQLFGGAPEAAQDEAVPERRDSGHSEPESAPGLPPQLPQVAQDIALLRQDLVRLSREMQSLQDTVRHTLTRPARKTAPDAQAQPAGAAPTRRTRQSSGPLHRVRAGDTLSTIAARHGLPIACLLRWNALHRSDVIYPGQGLHLSGDTPCTPARVQTQQRGGLNPQHRAAPGDPGPNPGHWVILGMNTRQVALLSPDQQTHLFAIGETIPGAGRITALDNRRKLVMTSQGVIHSLRD